MTPPDALDPNVDVVVGGMGKTSPSVARWTIACVNCVLLLGAQNPESMCMFSIPPN
jgi:hypothetical protein